MISSKVKKNPKGEHKHKKLISGVDGYKAYKKKYPNTTLSRKEYAIILEGYFEEVKNALLKGEEYKIPFRLGDLVILKSKIDLKKLKVNWYETNKLWKEDKIAAEKKQKIYHLNEHSGGNYCKVFWKKGKVKNISAITFLPIRSLKSEIASVVKTNNKDFMFRRDYMCTNLK